VVPGDHHGTYARTLREIYRVPDLCAGRVYHADETQKYEVALDVVIHLPVELIWRERPEGDAQGTQRLPGEPLVGDPDLLAALVCEGTSLVAQDLVRAAR
jgi:hypothetical protein